jgi:hypothetical protein
VSSKPSTLQKSIDSRRHGAGMIGLVDQMIGGAAPVLHAADRKYQSMHNASTYDERPIE